MTDDTDDTDDSCNKSEISLHSREGEPARAFQHDGAKGRLSGIIAKNGDLKCSALLGPELMSMLVASEGAEL